MRGSIGVPMDEANTSPCSRHVSPSARRSPSCRFLCSWRWRTASWGSTTVRRALLVFSSTTWSLPSTRAVETLDLRKPHVKSGACSAAGQASAPLARRQRRALPWRPARRTPGHSRRTIWINTAQCYAARVAGSVVLGAHRPARRYRVNADCPAGSTPRRGRVPGSCARRRPGRRGRSPSPRHLSAGSRMRPRSGRRRSGPG